MSPFVKSTHDELQTTALSKGGGLVVSRIGKIAACLIVVMVAIQFSIVVMRSVFDVNFIWVQEFVLGLHGLSFMLIAPWTLMQMRHVRIDVFSERFSKSAQSRVNLFGFFFLLVPMMVAILASSFGYVIEAWSILEGSTELSGLPGKFLLKTVIPIFAVLMVLAAVVFIWPGHKPTEPKQERDGV